MSLLEYSVCFIAGFFVAMVVDTVLHWNDNIKH